MKSAGRIAKRYARALFALAKGDMTRAKQQLEVLETVAALFDTKDGGKVLRSPVMPRQLKSELLEYGLKQSNADATVQNSVRTVLDSGRVAVIPEVATAYRELIHAAEGIADAEITTAVALPAAELDAIAAGLGKIIGKKVIATGKVDPSVLGGFEASVGNYRVDLSLKSKLDGLAQAAVQDSSR